MINLRPLARQSPLPLFLSLKVAAVQIQTWFRLRAYYVKVRTTRNPFPYGIGRFEDATCVTCVSLKNQVKHFSVFLIFDFKSSVVKFVKKTLTNRDTDSESSIMKSIGVVKQQSNTWSYLPFV